MTVSVYPLWAGVGWALHIQAGCILPAPQEGGHFHFPDEKPSTCQPQHHPSSLDPASILARKAWGNRACPSLQTRRQVTCVVGQQERWRVRGGEPAHTPASDKNLVEPSVLHRH